MKRAQIVIGSNFGDEGKGLVTDYLARKASERGESCLVVLHNGGAQRGHTVCDHVFHHYGSGTFSGAITYFAKDFIINPIIFKKEREELLAKYGLIKGIENAYVNPFCKVTFPSDMIVNQIVEEMRGDGKHGSCGLGIYETIKSYRLESVYIEEGLNIVDRLEEYGIDYEDLSDKWKNVIDEIGNIFFHFTKDHRYFESFTTKADDDILDQFDTVIFEGGQGLLLDQHNMEYYPNLTPSNTGILNPADMLLRGGYKGAPAEAFYVTRTYMTRHGAGRFDTECKKEDINPIMIDETNVPNEFQGSLRYGYLDVSDLKKRINKDIEPYTDFIKKSIVITHVNEYENGVAKEFMDDPSFNNVYISINKHDLIKRSK